MKKWFACLLMIVGVCLFFPANAHAETQVPKQSGLNLDIARRYYSVASIKKYIDTLDENGAQFLHLHFSDNENYGIESKILKQTKATAKVKKGVYTNPLTGKRFLSYEQVMEIAEYAHLKGIEIIPEIDSPGHMWGIRDLLDYNDMDDSIFAGSMSSDQANELDLTNPKSLLFMENLFTESLQCFPHTTRVHLGGDEFSYDEATLHDFAAYVNALTTFLKKQGIQQTLLWNDTLHDVNIDEFDKNVVITYWTYSNWDGGPADRGKLTMPELLQHGFSVYNYNGYYLYFVPSQESMKSEAIAYREKDMRKNWNLGMWDNNTGKFTEITDQILGSAMSIWGEESASFSDNQIFKASSVQLKDMIAMNQQFGATAH